LNQSKQELQLSIKTLQDNIRKYEETFVNVGLIQSSADLAQSENVDKKYQDVVGLYYQDIIEKFKLMESFADNLQKFVETLNGLYTTKKVRTSQNGLTITFNDKDLDLDSLSSGEKHVIVMFGKLIFDTADDMLLLIDEPEISLHPAWQERFMEIVRQIQSQHKNVKIVIATHSPLIFGGFIDSDDIIDLEQIEGMVQ
jgi:predicted ATP-dependent endonuclease of OLD family